MAPKKAAATAAAKQKKAEDKTRLAAKQKAVEDKTFGLKNKNKSKAVQSYVKTLEKSVADAAKRKNLGPDTAKKDKKRQEEEQARELAELFTLAIKQPKVPLGVDPKSIVCEYFRHGQCTKGFKCKFSHDLNVERKGGKIDIYSDRREGDEEENMEEWDQAKLESVVKQKHGAETGNANKQTDIICKFFLDAVENKQYGWFWQCPNGKDCKYRHGLPPGYVLKSQMKELLEAEAENSKSIEEVIEEERAKVDAKTPITEEVFRRWHNERMQQRLKDREDEEAERKRKGVLTGREIFMQDGFVAEDDLGASADYLREEDEDAAFDRVAAEARRAEEAARQRAGVPFGAPGNGDDDATSCAEEESSAPGPSGTKPQANGSSSLKLTAEEEALLFDDDDDLSDEELDALQANLSGSSTS